MISRLIKTFLFPFFPLEIASLSEARCSFEAHFYWRLRTPLSPIVAIAKGIFCREPARCPHNGTVLRREVQLAKQPLLHLVFGEPAFGSRLLGPAVEMSLK